MKRRIILVLVVNLLIFISVVESSSQTRYVGDPVKKPNLIRVLKSKKYRTEEIVKIIRKNGVNFKVNASTVKQLFRAGARPVVIRAVRENYRGSLKSTSRRRTRSKDRYQSLLDIAIDRFDGEKDVGGAIRTLENAVKLKPSKPRAYQLLGFAYLYGKGDLSAAERYMRKAIARGGSAVFRVRHADDATFATSCTGSFYLDGKGFRYEDDANKHTIDVLGPDIKKVTGKAGYWGFRKLLTFKRNMFEVSYRDRKNLKKKNDQDIYRFAPLSGKKQEKKLIIKLLKETVK